MSPNNHICTSANTLCKKCLPIYHQLTTSKKFKDEDLLTRPRYFAVTLRRIYPISQRPFLPSPITKPLKTYLNSIFWDPRVLRTKIHEAQILLLPGGKHFEVRILVDIPPKRLADFPSSEMPSTRELPDHTRWLMGGMVEALDIDGEGRDRWEVRASDGASGQCASSVRLGWFLDLEPYVGDLELDAGDVGDGKKRSSLLWYGN